MAAEKKPHPHPAKAVRSTSEESRTLLLRFHDGDFESGNVPVFVLAQKLQALQTLLYHASAAVQGDRSQRRGQWVSKHREVAELAFSTTEPGSLKTFFELRFQDSNLFAVQNKVLTTTAAVLTAASAGKPLPADLRPEDRTHLLRAVEELCPSTLDDYRVDVGIGKQGATGGHAVSLSGETRHRIREMVVAEEMPPGTEDYEMAIGTLVQTNIGKGDDKIVIRLPRTSGGVEVDCFYPAQMRDQVANLIGGSLVEVVGFVTRTGAGGIEKFTEVFGLEMVDADPIRLRTLRFDGTRYTFTKPVSFDVEYVDGTWAYSNDLLNVSGFAHSREAALKDLAEAMDYVWREFAKAKDADLDAKAIELKHRLLDTVEAKALAKEAR